MMQDRLQDLQPTSEKIHRVMLKSHRERYGSKPVGSMVRLGPSVTSSTHREHIWDTAPGEWTFGSSVPYAGFYSKWREQEEGDPLLKLEADDLERIAQILLEYVVNGR